MSRRGPDEPLTGGAVVVRALGAADAPALAGAVAPGEACALGPLQGPLTVAAAEELIAEFAPGRRTRRQAAFAVLAAAGGELLGCLTLQYQTPFMEPAADEAEVAYWVRSDQRGRGIATAALTLLADWALGDDDDRAGDDPQLPPSPRLRRLWLETDPGHHASRTVAESAGFRLLGTLPRAVGGQDATADHCLIYERLAPPR